MNIRARCRRCEGCLNVRQTHWTLAAAREQVRAKKVFMVTLTYGGAARSQVYSEATKLQQVSHRDLSQSQRLVRASGVYITHWLKRVRKAGLKVRYMIVPEPHRDGFPHYHGLIFGDDEADGLVVKDPLTRKASVWGWGAGFSQIAVVKDARALRYVCKYLSKERFGRVRASKQFGVIDAVEGRPTWDPTLPMQPKRSGAGARASETMRARPLYFIQDATTEQEAQPSGLLVLPD